MEQFIWSIPTDNECRPYTKLPKGTAVEFYVTAHAVDGGLDSTVLHYVLEEDTYVWDIVVKFDKMYVEWTDKCRNHARVLYIELGRFDKTQLPGLDTQSFQFQYGT